MTSNARGPFLSLGKDSFLKRLETPYLYEARRDELYELDEEALAFLASSPSIADAVAQGTESAELVKTCLDEGLALETTSPRPIPLPSPPSFPTLRYLLVHITERCNLKCLHCFQGKASNSDLALEEVLGLAGEFARLQGLRFIVSGGEPLLHPRFGELNDALTAFPFRSILLTNGTLVDETAVRGLRFHEVQLSIDGLEKSHDFIRGKGTYERTLRALGNLADAGTDISVATMVHAANINEFDELKEVLSSFPLKSWSVDVPCLTGTFADNAAAAAFPEEAAAKMNYSFGGGYYGSSGAYACGAHLAAVMANGSICKCGHYGARPEGTVQEGLESAWKSMRRYRLDELSCRCSEVESCRGGCRYRAEIYGCIYDSDPIQCFARGVPVGGDLMYAFSARKSKNEGG